LGVGLDLDEDAASVEEGDGNPADGDESDGIEQRGEGLVRYYVRDRAIEQLLEVCARVGMDAAEG
jgi:hypothetical protein